MKGDFARVLQVTFALGLSVISLMTAIANYDEIVRFENFSNSFRAGVVYVSEKMITPKTSHAVTMYTSRIQETDSSPCIAAKGDNICELHKNGKQVCASNDYKFGTKIYVEGLGECVVLDRMNSRYTGTGHIDWYAGMDLDRAISWGIKTKEIAIIQ